MGIITTQHSMSVDGFIADREGGGRLHAWLRAGGVQSMLNPAFAMDPVNVKFFDEGVSRCGAVIAGRRTYDVSNGWGGAGPMGPGPCSWSPTIRPSEFRLPILPTPSSSTASRQPSLLPGRLRASKTSC